MKDVLVTDFSGVLEAEEFLPWLQAQGGVEEYRNWRELEGTACYCDACAQERILAGLPERLPRLRWIDSGDYHYMSHLLAMREQEPFHLVLLDHHPDNQAPAFEGVLSCGSWVKELQEGNTRARSVLSIGGSKEGRAGVCIAGQGHHGKGVGPHGLEPGDTLPAAGQRDPGLFAGGSGAGGGGGHLRGADPGERRHAGRFED